MKGHNEGNIRKRKDGRWEVRISAGIDPLTGNPVRVSKYAKTKAEAAVCQKSPVKSWTFFEE